MPPEELTENIQFEEVNVELSESHRLELDRRLAQFELDGKEGSDWASVKNRLTKCGES